MRLSAVCAGHDSNVKMCIRPTGWKLDEIQESRASCLVRQILADPLAFCVLAVLLWRAWRLLLPDGSCASFISKVRVACSSAAFPLQRCSRRLSAAGRTLPCLQHDRGFQLEWCRVLPRTRKRADTAWCFAEVFAEVQVAVAEPERSIRYRQFHSKPAYRLQAALKGGPEETDASLKRLRHDSGLKRQP